MKVLYFLLFLSIPVSIGFIVFRLINKSITRRRELLEQKLNDESTGEQAIKELNEGMKKMYYRLKYLIYARIFLSILLIALGLIALYYLIEKAINNDLQTIFTEYNGIQFYIVGPLMGILGVIMLIKNIKSLKEYKSSKKSSNMVRVIVVLQFLRLW